MEEQQRQLEESGSSKDELCDLKVRLGQLNARLEAQAPFSQAKNNNNNNNKNNNF